MACCGVKTKFEGEKRAEGTLQSNEESALRKMGQYVLDGGGAACSPQYDGLKAANIRSAKAPASRMGQGAYRDLGFTVDMRPSFAARRNEIPVERAASLPKNRRA